MSDLLWGCVNFQWCHKNIFRVSYSSMHWWSVTMFLKVINELSAIGSHLITICTCNTRSLPSSFGIVYTLLHELACNITSYCTSGRGRYFHEPWQMKMQPTSEIIAICMLTSVIKCLLSIPEQHLVSSHAKYQVTHCSNVLILIKAHCGC